MRTLFVTMFIAVAAATCFAQTGDQKGNPGSLFDSTYVNPFIDSVARRAGDLLTVIIDEESTAKFASSTEATKNDRSSISTQFFSDLLDRLFRPISTGSNSSVSGDGKTSQSSSMAATLTVIVKQVLANGNLVIEGHRTLITNKQTQTFTLSGVVRQADIKPNNTIASSQIAEMDVKMDGSGLIADRQRKGILTRIIDWLF